MERGRSIRAGTKRTVYLLVIGTLEAIRDECKQAEYLVKTQIRCMFHAHTHTHTHTHTQYKNKKKFYTFACFADLLYKIERLALFFAGVRTALQQLSCKLFILCCQ